MEEKPRIRVPAGSSKSFMTGDSFQNFAARIGLGTDNLQSAATYGFNPITRNRQLLEWMYGGSWIVGKTVDCVAEDMTRAGVTLHSMGDPDEVEELQQAMNDLAIWPKVNDTIKWSRLYGGAIGVYLIDGQRLDTPLRLKAIGKDQFKGMAVLDRWMVNPSLSDLITQPGPEMGDPKFYDVVVSGGPLQRQKIHHSRVMRLDGIPQPYWRKMAENWWGLSVIEPLYDRLVAFDSTTNGAAQLVHKAHLRTIKVEKLREIIAAGGKAMEGLAKQMDLIRLYQTNEGMTLLDATDDFEAHQYTFAGLDDVLLQFAQQLAGATGIPLVRLFGESPAGLNATGESDIRNYYDGIAAQQESRLRRPVTKLLHIMHASVLGKPAEDGFNFKFTPLWQLSETEKADIVGKVTTAVTQAYDSAVIDRPTAMKELRSASQVSGVFGNISDEDIQEAEAEPPPMPEGEDDEDAPDAEDVPGEEKTDPKSPQPKPGGAKDAEFKEADHPRRDDGKFGNGPGGAKGSAGKAKVKPPAEARRGEHFIPAAKFNAASFAASHDDPHASAASVLAAFPSDTAAKIKSTQDRLAATQQTASAFKSDGQYDPARAELHRKIVIEGVTRRVMDEKSGEMVDRHYPGILSPERVAAATPAEGELPTFTILGGRGGSGKSWFKGKVYDEDSAIVLDSDHIKQLLPEYEGWNAAQVHEESGEIFDKITEMAREMGLNIVHDSTMKSPEKAVRLVKEFKAAGYRAEAHYMHLPRQEAAKRAVERFLGKTQRLVPPAVVLENTENEKSFDEVRKLADKWSFRDNNVPRGQEPRLISASGS